MPETVENEIDPPPEFGRIFVRGVLFLSLGGVKEHCNVSSGADDAVINGFLYAAVRHVERLLGYKIDDEIELPNGPPDDLRQAVQMLIAHWYENREASVIGVSAQPVPFGFSEIIREHRKYTFG